MLVRIMVRQLKLLKKNFVIENILAFEPSKINFKILKKSIKMNTILNFLILQLEKKREKINLQQHYGPESSTIVQIDQNTNYYKKKTFI